MLCPLLRAILFVVFLSAGSLLRAESINRTPPAPYGEHLAALLTPLDKVLAGRDTFPKADSHGTILLDEIILYRDAAGLDYRVYHDVRLAHDDSASETMGNNIITFDREHESIFLVTAATVRPDGQRQELDDRAAFIQSPQHEAENGLYTSNLELNLIFPKILPGAVTESIVVVRVDKPVFPGEFAYRTVFSSGWPTFLERIILDLPAPVMERIHLIASSSQIPEPQVTEPAAGRIRKIWQRDRTASLNWEESAPALEFRAPTLWMTTLDSWDQVAGWFDDLVKDRSGLGAELEKEVEGWTAGLTDRREILDKLCAVVANDVRYTGLEFGLAGYQPYPCAQVWANRYGDCKDKANLLRAMLAHKGIRSHLVLLSTERLGRVEQRSPSWRQFTHCILAVENPDGSLLFCDPTIKHLPAGQIGRSDSGRPVLVVRDRHAEWVQTPDVLIDEITYGAETTLAASGELSGWFSIRAKAGDAAGYAVYYNDMDVSERSRALQRILEGFFPGAQVVDVDFHPHTGTVVDFQIRVYFLRKPNSAKLETIAFPYTASWLPTVSTTGARKFPYATTRRREILAMTITLPDGWSARQLPETFEANSPSARFAASWKSEGPRLTAAFQWQPEMAELSPADYAIFQRSVRALRSWMEQPAHIANGGPATATAATPKTSLENFPLLATGEGQMRLLAQRFPSGNNQAARRAALEQVLQWFPDDVATCFEAKVFIALIDGNDDDALLARTIHEHVEHYDGRVTPESRAWAQYLEGRSRWWSAKEPAAITDLQKLAADTSLSSFRRAWCAYYAGAFLSEKEPAAALAYLKDFDTQAEEARDDIINLEVRLLYRLADASTTRAWAERLAKLPPTEADTLFADAFNALIKKRPETPEAAYAHLSQALAPALQPLLPNLPKTAGQLKILNTIAESVQHRDRLNHLLTTWLDANPRSWLTREKSTKFKDTAALLAHLKEKDEASEGQAVIDGSFQLLRYHDVDYATYAKYLYWACWWLQRDRLEPELLTRFAEATYDLPIAESTDIIEAWLRYALALRGEKKIPAARALYQKIIDEPNAKDHQHVEASGELARLELEQGEMAAALAAYAITAKDHLSHQRGSEYLFGALLLNLELHHYDEALVVLQAIAKDDPKYRDKTKYADILKYLLPLATQPKELLAFWRRQETWRPAWQTLLRKYGVTPPALHSLPLIADITGTQNQMDVFVKNKDEKKFLKNLDLFVRCAGWVPLFTSNVCKLSAKADGISPQLIKDLYNFDLGVVTDFPSFDEVAQRNARLWHASMLIDLQRPAEALPIARRLYEDFGPGHSFGSVGLRLWILAAATDPNELPKVVTVATDCLASGQPVDNRADTVATLSDSLDKSQAVAANIALLSRELVHPDLVASTAIKSRLTQRLEFLRKDSSASAEFTAQIRAWLKSRKLEWVLAVPPLTLDQPRYANPTDNGTYGNSPLSYSEESIGNLRLALDEQKPVTVRHLAFQKVTGALSYLEPQADDYAEFYASVLRIKALPQGVRDDLLTGRAAFLIKYGHPAAAAKLFAAEPDTKNRERLLKIHAPSLAAAKVLVDYNAPQAAEACKALLSEPVGQFEGNLITALLVRMVQHGDTALATSLVDGATTIKPSAGASQSANGLRLDWTRRIRRETAQLALLSQVSALLAKACAPTPADAKDFRKLTWPLSLSSLPHKSRAKAAAGYFTEKAYTAAEPVEILWRIASATSFVGNLNDLGPDLEAVILTAEVEDLVRAQWLQAVTGMIDFDTPAIRERMVKQIDEFLARTDPSATAQTRRIIRIQLATLALRTDTTDRPEALFSGPAVHDLGQQAAQTMQFIYLASREQTAAALALLDAIDADVLAGLPLYPYAHRLLNTPERQTELKLLAAATREKLLAELPSLWLEAAPQQLIYAADAARLIDATDLLPDALFDHALATQNDEFERSMIRLARASLHQDWAAQRKAAQGVLDRLDEFYLAHFYRGEAAYHLGDFAAAKRDLETFSGKARESHLLPEARRLLAEIAAQPAS